MEVALTFFRNVLRWGLSLPLYPDQRMQPLDPEAVDLEEFCWAGVAPTAAAERQILEFAAGVARSFTAEPDVNEARLRELLLERQWVAERPVHEQNRALYSRLGPIRYAAA